MSIFEFTGVEFALEVIEWIILIEIALVLGFCIGYVVYETIPYDFRHTDAIQWKNLTAILNEVPWV